MEVYKNPANSFIEGFLCAHLNEIVDTANSLFGGEEE